MNKLLNVNKNVKTIKNLKVGHLTGILYLASGNISGYEVCPARSKGCFKGCLFNSGGFQRFAKVRQGAINKTKRFFEDRENFMNQLVLEIASLRRKAEREGLKPSIRLNGTSDIKFESITVADTGKNLMEIFPDVLFYDYTKLSGRKTPKNYTLTFSRSEINDRVCKRMLKQGHNVSVVFQKELPATFWGYPVIDGDAYDARPEDKKGVIVGLIAKGTGRKDDTGFVIKQPVPDSKVC